MRLTDYYKWIAVLEDGTIIEQTTPSAIKFRDDDENYCKIKQFILTKKYAEDNLSNVSMTLNVTERLKFFRRKIANIKTNATFEIYILGTIGGQCLYVFPDGHSQMTSDDDPSYIQDFINIYNI